jgi:S-formylglutathione hydrolase FrmB
LGPLAAKLPSSNARGRQIPKLVANKTHDWAYWGSQLQQMKPDLQRALGAKT